MGKLEKKVLAASSVPDGVKCEELTVMKWRLDVIE